MQTIIRTSYVNVNGTPKVLAKANGKQRTTLWYHGHSTDWNHGNAAGTLAKVLGLSYSDEITHDSNDAGTKHGFAFPSNV